MFKCEIDLSALKYKQVFKIVGYGKAIFIKVKGGYIDASNGYFNQIFPGANNYIIGYKLTTAELARRFGKSVSWAESFIDGAISLYSKRYSK